MFKNGINFAEDLQEHVEIFDESGTRVGVGELKLSSGRFPQVFVSYDVYLEPYRKIKTFKCKGKSHTFILLACRVVERLIIPELIVRDLEFNKSFRKISFLLSGISIWMNNAQPGKLENGIFTKECEKERFKVEITDVNDRKFLISNDCHWSTSRVDNKSSITEYSLLTIEALDEFFSVQEVIQKGRELEVIFSLLTGFSVSIQYAYVRNDEQQRSYVYFVNTYSENKTIKRQIDCLTNSQHIFENKLWDKIFNNYYTNSYNKFNNIWIYFVGMLVHNGFWDHEILGYLSIVDRYVSEEVASYSKKIPRSKFNRIVSALKDQVDTYSLEETPDSVIENIKRQVDRLINSDLTTFAEKFSFIFETLDDHVKKVIDFSTEDFIHMKRVRDSVAHGSPVTTKTDNDLTYEIQLLNKIKLLLLYWIYSDFGFDEFDYFTFLEKARFNEIVQIANIDKDELQCILFSEEIVEVTPADFKKAEQQNFRGVVLFYDLRSCSYSFHDQASNIALECSINPSSKAKTIETSIVSKLNNIQEYENIAYVGNVVLRCVDNKKSLSVCILNCADGFFNSLSGNRILKRANNFE